MKFRYISNGSVYFPHFLNKESEWRIFLKSDIEKTILDKIASALGSGRWGEYYNSKGEIYFDNEIKVCAFLGAAKKYYSPPVEFEP